MLNLEMTHLRHDAIIPMLHRVGIRDSKRIPANQNMVIEQNELANFVQDARKRGWDFICLDELVELFLQKKSSKKVIALTFDDGYLDNYEQAFPILSDLNVPFCVYVTTGFVGNKDIPWWYRLENALLQFPEVVDPRGKLYSTKTVEERQTAFMSIRRDLMASHQQFLRYASWLAQFESGVSSENFGRLFMTWQELQRLAESELVTVGAHTLSHPVLASLEDGPAYDEIKLSRDMLSNKLNRDIKHFAFPFGGKGEVSSRDIGYAKQIGFSTAVTTIHGGISTRSNANLFALPRLFFGPNFHLRSIHFRLLKAEAKRIYERFIGLE